MIDQDGIARRRLFPAALCCVVLGFIGSADSAALAAEIVKLTVDYGDGVEKHFTRLKFNEEMTVLDATRAAEKHARGIKAAVRGRGETAFLTQIDDVKNEGSGKNWVYRVNGKLGDRSIGIHKLQAGDDILWRFQEYE